MLGTLLDALAVLPVPVVIGVVALVLVAESGTYAGMALPGTTLLVGLGIWTTTAPGTVLPAIAAAACGTVAGAHVGWWRGRSRPVTTGARAAVAERASRLGRRLTGRGPGTVVVLLAAGHWAAAARPLLPRLVGAAGTPYRLAGPVLAVTGTAWAATLVLLGERVGAQLLTQLGWVPIALVAVLVAGLLLRGARPRTALPEER